MRLRFNSLRSQLLLSSLIPVVLFLATAVVAYLTIQHLLRAQEWEAHSREVLTEAFDVRASTGLMLAAKSGHHLLGEEKFRRSYHEYWEQFQDELRALREQTRSDGEQLRRLDAIAELARQWHEFARIDFEALPEQPKGPAGVFARPHLTQMMDLGDRIVRRVEEVIAAERRLLDQRREVSRRATANGIMATIVAVLSATVLAVLLPLQLSRMIARPIERLGDATNQLRKGSFTTLAPSGPTEIAALISYFNMMGLALSEREALLRTSERRYQGLVGSLSNLLWTMDARGKVTADMGSWLSYTGQSAQELADGGWLAAVHPEDRERVTAAWRHALGSSTPFEQECRLRRNDGTYRTFACRCVPIFGPGEKLLEWVCACTDVTERREQEKLEREKEALEAAGRAKDAFLAKMSHELRTPLNAVIGMSKMLSSQRFGPLNLKQADYLSDITKAGNHLLALINDVLDLSKVQAGLMEVTFEPVAVGDAVGAALRTVRPLAEGKLQRLEFRSETPDGRVETDLGRFKQVLLNLLSNAIKFTPEGGRVTVRSRWVRSARRDAPACPAEEAGGLRIDVEDTGIGIPPDEQEKVWEEFRQASNREQTIEGTGLGLALSRRLVRLLGGEIWLSRSAPGEGSCFSFTLPLRGAAPRAAPQPAAEPARPKVRIAGAGQPLVLVVEDNVPTNKLVCDWLAEVGLRTSSAFGGQEGLEQARRLRPDLIVLDLLLPGLNGREVLARLKDDPATADIPVIVASVLEDDEAPAGVKVLDWFVKPTDREHFIARLRAVCPELFDRERPPTALVVDANPSTRSALGKILQEEGFAVVESAEAGAALELLEQTCPDLLVLDLVPPGADGPALVRGVRRQPAFRRLPIVAVADGASGDDGWEQLGDGVQAVIRREELTKELIEERLQELGLLPPPRRRRAAGVKRGV